MTRITDAMDFVISYTELVAEIENVVKPEHYPAIRTLYCTNPHDLVTPETIFTGEGARGYVWALFLKETKKLQTT